MDGTARGGLRCQGLRASVHVANRHAPQRALRPGGVTSGPGLQQEEPRAVGRAVYPVDAASEGDQAVAVQRHDQRGLIVAGQSKRELDGGRHDSVLPAKPLVVVEKAV